jgi:hypothetical protein
MAGMWMHRALENWCGEIELPIWQLGLGYRNFDLDFLRYNAVVGLVVT